MFTNAEQKGCIVMLVNPVEARRAAQGHNMSLGERLRERRTKLGLTNGQVAMYMGISKAHITEMEKGRSNPSLDLLRRLATYYRTTTDWLLEQTDDPRPRDSATDIEKVYTRQESLEIFADLPDSVRVAMTRLAVSLQESAAGDRERVLGQFIYRMLGDIEDQYGEQAIEELTAAADLFARTGDDSGLRAWFRRFFGANGF